VWSAYTGVIHCVFDQKPNLLRPSFVEVSGHNLESVLGLNVSVYNVYIINQFKTTFAQVGGEGGQ
jgi:hypothetical protein